MSASTSSKQTPRVVRTLRSHGRILASFLIISALVFAFDRLASEVVAGDTMAFDRYLMAGLRNAADSSVPVGPRWLQTAMLDITSLGGVSVLTLLTMFVAGYLIMIRKVGSALFVVMAVSTGAIGSTLLKSVFERPRPDLVSHLVTVNTTSFPSGHAMNSAVVYLTLGALLARTRTERITRVYILSVAVVLTLMIGFSRVYLGVHWASDVIAGWVVGASWALLCSTLMRFLQQRTTVIETPKPSPSDD